MNKRGKLESGGVGSVAGPAGVAFAPGTPGLDVVPRISRENTCQNVPFLVGKNDQQMTAVLFRPRCKLWSCESCARTNADWWQMRAVVGTELLAAQGHELVLVTVTAHERHSVKRAVECLPDQWNKLRCRWQYHTNVPQYILVGEVGKKGHFHIHFITTGSMGTKWWKDNARKSGFGYSNDESERGLNPGKAGMYIGKYLAKQLRNNIWKKGLHRVRTSQNWPKIPPLERDENWQFSVLDSRTSLRDAIDHLDYQGYIIRMADGRSAWSLITTGELDGTWKPDII